MMARVLRFLPWLWWWLLGGPAFAQAGPPPAIPPAGTAYLGAWINPLGGDLGQTPAPQIAAFSASAAPPAIVSVYAAYGADFPATAIGAAHAAGAIPMLSWGMNSVAAVNSGADDARITAYASQVAALGYPIFLRWAWEMNNRGAPGTARASWGAYGNGPAYAAAFRHVVTLFRAAGASNAAFVWAPGAHGDASSYYPGDGYVDWLGADRYDRAGRLSFGGLFRPWFTRLSAAAIGRGKPCMVSETGAGPSDQAAYIASIATAQIPCLRAVVWFDAAGPNGTWTLTPDGLAAWRTLANSPAFGARP